MAQIGILEVKVKPDLAGFQSEVNAAVRNVASGAAAVGAQVTRDLAGIGARLAAGGAIAVGVLAGIGIKTAAGLETATLQFQTLLGSAEEAQAKVAELFEFAKKTPFESGPIIEASRRLQVFGGDALNTAENMTRIGDASAAVAAPIEEIAFWVGRAYSQIQGGQPFGEAAMRLQELGVMTPEVNTAMKALAESGASADEVFGLLTARMDEFAGAMDLQANTLTGLTSTIKDQFSLGLAEAFAPAFESLKEFLGVLRDFGDSPVFDAIITQVSALTAAVMTGLNPMIQALEGALTGVTRSGVSDFFANLAGWMSDGVTAAAELYDTFEPLLPLIAGIGAAMASTFLGGVPVIGLLAPEISAVTGALLGLTGAVDGNRDAVSDFFSVIGGAAGDALPKLKGSIADIADAINSTFQGALRALTPAIQYLVADLFPTLADVVAELAGPFGDLVVAISELASSAIVQLGPILEAVARAVGSILASGIAVLADIIGFVADNATVAIPAIAGLAAAFATLRVANQAQELGSLVRLFDGLALKVLYLGDTLKSSTIGTAIGNIGSSAGGAAGAVGMGAGLAGALGALAIGLGVSIGVAKLTESMQKQKQEAAESADRIRTLTQLIQEYGDSAATASRYVEQVMEGDDDKAKETIQNLKDMGFSYAAIADAIAGVPGAQDQVIDGMVAEIAASEDLNAAQQARLEAYLRGEAAGKSFLNTTTGNRDATQEQAEAAKGLAGDLDDLAGEYSNATDEAVRYQTDTDKIKGITEDASQAVDNLRAALDRLKGGTTDLISAENDHLDAIDRTKAALAAAGGDLSGRTKESRDAREAIIAEKDAIEERLRVMIDSGASSEEAIARGAEWTNGLIESARAAGVSEEAIADMIEQYGLTPEDVQTTVALLGAESVETQIEDINTFLDEYDGTESTATLRALFAAGDIPAAMEELHRIEDIETVARITAALDQGNIVLAQQLLAGLNATEAIPGIRAALDSGNMTEAKRLLDIVANTNPNPTISTNDQATGNIRQVDTELESLDQDSAYPTVGVDDQTQGPFERIQNWLRQLDETVVEPTVRPRSQGVGSAGGGGVPMSAGPMAAPMSLLAAPMAASTDMARVLGRPSTLADLNALPSSAGPIVVENRTYLGQTEVTDVVKSEARVIERDRSMKYLTGVG